MATSFSGGRSRSTRREPPTMGKQLVNFITCGCESSAPFFVIFTCTIKTDNMKKNLWFCTMGPLVWKQVRLQKCRTSWLQIRKHHSVKSFKYGIILDISIMWDVQLQREYPERTTDHGQATGKLYHLRLRVECTLFCNLQSRTRTHAVLVIGLYELLGNPNYLTHWATSSLKRKLIKTDYMYNKNW
jgi:hypothetical protein